MNEFKHENNKNIFQKQDQIRHMYIHTHTYIYIYIYIYCSYVNSSIKENVSNKIWLIRLILIK